MIKELPVTAKIVKLLKENVGNNLSELVIGNNF